MRLFELNEHLLFRFKFFESVRELSDLTIHKFHIFGDFDIFGLLFLDTSFEQIGVGIEYLSLYHLIDAQILNNTACFILLHIFTRCNTDRNIFGNLLDKLFRDHFFIFSKLFIDFGYFIQLTLFDRGTHLKCLNFLFGAFNALGHFVEFFTPSLNIGCNLFEYSVNMLRFTLLMRYLLLRITDLLFDIECIE